MSEASRAMALRRGHFRDAYRFLAGTQVISDADAVLAAELFFFLGRSADARASVRRLLESGRLSSSLSYRCTTVLADIEWYAGDLNEGLRLYRKAVSLAEDSGNGDYQCRAFAQLLERTCDSTGFDSSLPLARVVRRHSARSADPHVHAQVHLTFGRLEAKAGHFSVAHRHFSLARKLLSSEHNLYLSSSIELDESVALWMAGDVAGATELAKRGSELATEIGWSRGCAVAFANLACLFVCSGRLTEAQRQIEAAQSEPFSSPSLRLALADTKARALMASGDHAAANRALSDYESETSVQPWYRLTAEQTRVQLALIAGEWKEALERIEKCIKVARDAKLSPILMFFQLARVEARLGLGDQPHFDGLPPSNSLDEWPLGIMGLFHSVLGEALTKTGHGLRGGKSAARAKRIIECAGDVGTLHHLNGGNTPKDRVRPKVDTHDLGDLDSAVALLELAGHPHILAREAFAVLQDAGCVEALALTASGPRGRRLIAVHGWTDAAALDAVRRASHDDFLTMGQHRDETWQILARPRPELDHRCTLAAVRKLVATARTLDGYRRDEKQRAALWPAETLEGDAESLWISEQSADLLSIARRIASAPLPVLLTGETGTGKEMLARVIHRASDRADRPMHPFNCTAVPRDMLDSQLFGYRKGAFTGADASFSGVIRAAAGGTLFLDEVGDIGLDLQPKLLRFLEHQEVHPLGEPHAIKVDVRIIAATNANLEQLVAQGRFREDLLYRLNVLKLHIPPLRERREEIPPLVQHYIRKFGDELRKGHPTLSDETLEYLLLYSWPGNIRQLANEVRRMIVLAEPDSTLTPALLSPEILASRKTVAASGTTEELEIRLRLDQKLPQAVELLEQTLVRRALARSHGRVEDAARLLGISRKGLFLKRRRWGMTAAP
jgi:DNA-binding NtrC family response regulator/tetratricopeptide (TPR) repeat protein